MTLKTLKEWIKARIPPNTPVYSGCIDAQKECNIGLYERDRGQYIQAIGGIDNNTYETRRYSLLVHWNKNYDQSEIVAGEIFNIFKKSTVIDGKNAFFRLLVSAPVPMGKDDKGIFEFVINFDMTVNKEE